MIINKQKILPLTFLLALSSDQMIARELHITLPNVAAAPKVNAKVIPAVDVIVHNSNFQVIPVQEINSNRKGILFSKRVPPNYNKKQIKKTKKISPVGEVTNNKVSAYLLSKYRSVDEVISQLEDSNFDIVAQYDVGGNGEYISVVFTNEDMLKAASKQSRGFASTLRLLIDNKNKILSINNPLYIMKAFMQDDYDESLAHNVLLSLKDSFEDLKDSKKLIKFSYLKKYQFMTGMPYYEDMLEVGSANNEELLSNIRKSKSIVYEQKLANGSTIVGVNLSKETNKFIGIIGYDNAELLPYPILIENNKAKILAPKYYIALMYPTLSMSQFMSIATTPGEIENDCDKIFR